MKMTTTDYDFIFKPQILSRPNSKYELLLVQFIVRSGSNWESLISQPKCIYINRIKMRKTGLYRLEMELECDRK